MSTTTLAPQARAESLGASIQPQISTSIDDLNRQLEKHDKRLAPPTDEFAPLDSGLDSLCFAIAVARLEDSRGRDPFKADDETGFSVSFGDFIRFYENAAN